MTSNKLNQIDHQTTQEAKPTTTTIASSSLLPPSPANNEESASDNDEEAEYSPNNTSSEEEEYETEEEEEMTNLPAAATTTQEDSSSSSSSLSSIEKEFERITDKMIIFNKRKVYDNEQHYTSTSTDQLRTENSLMQFYYGYRKNQREHLKNLELFKKDHVEYCLKSLERLSSSFESLDSSRPWLCYWILNSLDLLGAFDGLNNGTTAAANQFMTRERYENIRARVEHLLCDVLQDKTLGGFVGGPNHIPHLAPTYAAVNALMILRCYDKIDRSKVYNFLLSQKESNGGFHMHQDGEIDIRGVYCALSAATLLNITDEKLLSNANMYIKNCQTYEGGFGAFPGNEAHGGYTFCGLAAYLFYYFSSNHSQSINSSGSSSNKSFAESIFKNINFQQLLHWNSMRQMSFEGGFQGRTNKLVDACYSFWVGGTFPLIQSLCPLYYSSNNNNNNNSSSSGATNDIIHNTEYLSSLNLKVPPQVNNDSSSTSSSAETTTSSSGGYNKYARRLSCTATTTPLPTNFVVIEEEGEEEEQEYFQFKDENSDWIMDSIALQEYILLCAQYEGGGLRDKPKKGRDQYHTCYALSGLSVAQHNLHSKRTVLGKDSNLLKEVHPLFGISKEAVQDALEHFAKRKTL